jgi:hypothetical protein
MRIITFTFLFFFLISCVLSLQFPATVDKRIRSTLLVALKRFHRNGPAPCINKPVLSPMHRVKLESLPMDLMNQEVGSLLDLKSMINLRKTSINSKKLSDSMLKFRLANFCPYFVFDDLFLNDLLLYLLDKHFPETSNLSSPSVKDELQVLIIKFNYGYLNYNTIPRNIYFYLISFINEFVNGPNSTVPFTEELCMFDSIRLICKGESHKTLDYLKILGYGVFNELSLEILNLLLDNPSKEEIIQKLGIVDLYSWILSSNINPGLKFYIIEIFINVLSMEELNNIFMMKPGLSLFFFNSAIFGDRVLSDMIENNLSHSYPIANYLSFDSMYSICLQFPDSSPKCGLILKRVLRDMIPLEDINILDASNIKNIFALFMHFEGRSNIYQADLFSHCINSLSFSEQNLIILPYKTKIFFLDVFLKESYLPFRLFRVDGKFVMPYSFFFVEANHVAFSIFFELLNSKDPIILLFIMSKECLYFSKRYITDKFDLNRSYRFDLDIYQLDYFRYDFSKFNGMTLHFKQIIQELNNLAIEELFSSNPSEFCGDFIPSEPVISINPEMGSYYFS